MVFLARLISLLFLVTVAFAELKPKLVYLSYLNVPTKALKNQIIVVDIEAIIAMDEFLAISSQFSNGKNIKVLNENSPWDKVDANRIRNRYYLKVMDLTAKIPDFTLAVKDTNYLVETDTLVGKFLKVESIVSTSDNFSNIIANELSIKRHKVNRYNNDTNIIVIEMDSQLGNLEDISIANSLKQGIESIAYALPTTKAFYYAVIPNNLDEFSFSFFDTKNAKFKKINLHIEIDDDKVSTQSDLAPTESSNDLYKGIAALVIAFIFSYLFVTKKRFSYLLIVIVSVGLTLYFILPKEELSLRENTNVYLLPTRNSTIFFVTKGSMKGYKLKSEGDYIKIMLENEKIGWIRRDDIKKN